MAMKLPCSADNVVYWVCSDSVDDGVMMNDEPATDAWMCDGGAGYSVEVRPPLTHSSACCLSLVLSTGVSITIHRY